MSDRTLVTGFPTYLARRLVRRLLETSTEEQVTLLCRTKFSDEAQQFVRDLPPERARRCRILIGDICDIDLGLAGVEYTTLASEVTTIYHAAVISQLAAGRERIERVHVDGTRTVIDLASESPKLRRLVHLSTAAVAGARQGVVMEDELERGQRFRNLIEESRFEAEKLVQSAARRLPTTVVRPATIVGDSRTGEIHRLDGPYHFLQFLLTSPLDVSVPLPGRGAAPLHLVPIDFVVDAMVALGRHPAAAGSTFHLTDPSPFSARRVYELFAERADRKLPKGSVPTGLARLLLRAPGLERLGQIPREILEQFDHFVYFNCKNTLALLGGGEGARVVCPTFDQYVDALVRFVVDEKSARKRRTEEELPDPFG